MFGRSISLARARPDREMPKHNPSHNLDEVESAERKLAESRSRLRKFRDLQNSFFAGSAERPLAARIINEIEGLHQVLERLLQRFRGRSH
jgi:hypothetical protein